MKTWDVGVGETSMVSVSSWRRDRFVKQSYNELLGHRRIRKSKLKNVPGKPSEDENGT